MDVVFSLMLLAIPCGFIYVAVKYYQSQKKIQQLNIKLYRIYKNIEDAHRDLKEYAHYKNETESLKKYSVIVNAEKEAGNILQKSEDVAMKHIAGSAWEAKKMRSFSYLYLETIFHQTYEPKYNIR